MHWRVIKWSFKAACRFALHPSRTKGSCVVRPPTDSAARSFGPPVAMHWALQALRSMQLGRFKLACACSQLRPRCRCVLHCQWHSNLRRADENYFASLKCRGQPGQVRSGRVLGQVRVRLITRPKSRTMRAKRKKRSRANRTTARAGCQFNEQQLYKPEVKALNWRVMGLW